MSVTATNPPPMPSGSYIVSVFFGTTSASDTRAIAAFRARWLGEVVAVEFVNDSTVAGNDTNNCVLRVRCGGTSGSGGVTAATITTNVASGGFVAGEPLTLPTNNTKSNRIFEQGQIVWVEKSSVNGTGMATTNGRFILYIKAGQ